jgi:hypothetical protein
MKLRGLIAFAFLLGSALGCIFPGLETSFPSPMNPNTVSTIVVLTADAAASQTAVAQPSATEIPVGATGSRMTGTTVKLQTDGTTIYTDYDGGFDMIFPSGWLAVRPNSAEFNTALANDGADNPALHDLMTTDAADYNPKIDRLYSYILRPDIKKKSLLGFSMLAWDSGDSTLLDNASMGNWVQTLESSGGIKGFRADTAQLRENGNGVSMIEIGGRVTNSNGQASIGTIYSTIVLFKPTSNSLARIDFSYLQDYNAQISTDVRSIIDSIQVIGR